MKSYIFKGLSGLFLFFIAFNTVSTFAQSGSVDAVFIDETGKKTTLHAAEPMFDVHTADGLLFNKPENGAYWFTHPSTGKSRFSIEEIRYFRGDKKTYTIPEINFYMNKGENDFTIASSDKNKFRISTEQWEIDASKSFHVHINHFTETEIDISFNGAVSYTAISGTNKGNGTVEGKLHLYRKADQYGKTDKMPGCNCDANIYLWQYPHGEAYSRSLSACELAFKKKIFTGIQSALKPVYNLNGNNNGKLKSGEVNVIACTNCINTNTTNGFNGVCADNDNGYAGITDVGSEKKYWRSDDEYGIRMIASLDNNMPKMDASKASADQLKALMTDYQNKKISLEELQKKVKELQDDPQIKKENDDFKKAAILNDLTMKISINPDAGETITVLNDANAQIQHHIPSAIAEVVSPASKNSDGSWNKDKTVVYLGKFAIPVIGKNSYGKPAAIAKNLYPNDGNKLSAYGIMLTFTGDPKLTEKAIANINWEALLQLLKN